MLTDQTLANVTQIAGYDTKVRLIQDIGGLTSKVVGMFARVEVQVPELDGVVIDNVNGEGRRRPDHAYALWHNWFVASEDERVHMLTLTPDVMAAFRDAVVGTRSHWDGAYAADGVWTFSMTLDPRRDREVERQRVLDALELLTPIFEALAAEQRPEDVLAQWASTRGYRDFAYTAVRMLAQDYPDSTQLAELRASIDTAHAVVRDALIFLDDGLDITQEERLEILRGFGRGMSREAAESYARRFPWDMVANRELTAPRRLMAAEHAPRDPLAPDDPDARDAHLLSCFTAREFNEHARFYTALRAGGWTPTLATRLHLVERGHRDMAKRMVEELRAQTTLSADDAAVIEALREEGLDVADLTERVRLLASGGGQLTLAREPEAAGGLTQAAEAGGLEVKGE